jgi:hypothetical protein
LNSSISNGSIVAFALVGWGVGGVLGEVCFTIGDDVSSGLSESLFVVEGEGVNDLLPFAVFVARAPVGLDVGMIGSSVGEHAERRNRRRTARIHRCHLQHPVHSPNNFLNKCDIPRWLEYLISL